MQCQWDHISSFVSTFNPNSYIQVNPGHLRSELPLDFSYAACSSVLIIFSLSGSLPSYSFLLTSNQLLNPDDPASAFFSQICTVFSISLPLLQICPCYFVKLGGCFLTISLPSILHQYYPLLDSKRIIYVRHKSHQAILLLEKKKVTDTPRITAEALNKAHGPLAIAQIHLFLSVPCYNLY